MTRFSTSSPFPTLFEVFPSATQTHESHRGPFFSAMPPDLVFFCRWHWNSHTRRRSQDQKSDSASRLLQGPCALCELLTRVSSWRRTKPWQQTVWVQPAVSSPNVCLPSASMPGWQEAHSTSQDSCSVRWLPCHSPSSASSEQLWGDRVPHGQLCAVSLCLKGGGCYMALQGELLQGDAGAFYLEGECSAAFLISASLLYHLLPTSEVKPLKWNFALAGSSCPSAPTTAEL